MERTEDEACRQLTSGLCCYALSMAGCSQVVVEIRAMHIKTILINARNSAYDFRVKLSPHMCNPGWRNGSNLLVCITHLT